MKKVTLLGDSIRAHGTGYGDAVAQMLEETNEYAVYQPMENCRFALYTLRMIYDYRARLAGSDIIHWNNGLWDVCRITRDGELFVSREDYVKTTVRIAKELKAVAPRVIFSTITPVRDENEIMSNADVDAFNAAVVPELRRLGVEIIDLHGIVWPHRAEYVRADDHVHLTAAGIDACAREIVRVITGK